MKRFWLILLLCLLIVQPAMAEEFKIYFCSSSPSSLTSAKNMPVDAISVDRIDKKYYLFLPSGWNAENLYIYFTGTKVVSLNKVDYRSGDPVSLQFGSRVNVKAQSGKTFTMQVLQSAGVPSVFVHTKSGTINAIKNDKTVKEAGLYAIFDAEGNRTHEGLLEYVRTRGNSSFKYEKKSFQIKLDKSLPLFGMNADKKWILLANYRDKSLLRNTISYAIARYANAYTFVPEVQAVDLYLNHGYFGSFQLAEKCEIDPDRLDIDDIEKTTEKINPLPLEEYPAFGNRLYELGKTKGVKIENDPEDLSGGYLVLANSRLYYAHEISGFVSRRGQAFTIDQPKYASEKQAAYLYDLFQQVEDALFADDGINPTTGKHWSEYLDRDTFLHRYLQAEITADLDGQKPYFYKDSDANDPMLYCAPIWDQDITFGSGNLNNSARKFYICNDNTQKYFWFVQAMKHKDFKQDAISLYNEIYAPALRILLGEETDQTGTLLSLDEYAGEIAASAALDNVRWPISRHRKDSFNPRTGQNQQANVEYLRGYIKRRLEFLNSQWGDQ